MSGGRIQNADDPTYVALQYATECGLAARAAAYSNITGRDAREVAREAIVERNPRTVLEVGCGAGELAEHIVSALGVDLIAVDLSPRMVELSAARGLDARIADVQELPFADSSFDVVVAAWMLYHVPDLDRGIREILRVLRPGGALIAVTNAPDHLRELWQLAGLERWELPFDGDNGQERLVANFATVERREAYGTVTFADIAAVRSYYASSARLEAHLAVLPEKLDTPLVARRTPVVLVAEKVG